MSFDVRLAVTCGIFFIGMQVAYFGMKFNGDAHPENPAWQIVNWLHSMVTFGPLCVLAFIFLVEVVIPFVASITEQVSEEKSKEWKRIEWPTLEISPERVLELQEQRRKKEEECFEAQKVCEEESRKAALKAYEMAELEQKRIFEKRRSRTAEDVARSALDDFL